MTSKFKEDLKVRTEEQQKKTEREIDAYKLFISEALPGYIGFMEAINHTITELQYDGIIGKTKVRTRIKAINSAIANTRKKVLDDIFGFELIAENERDKEILMLIIHNLFLSKFVREKNHNKSNGYYAHHCVGGVKPRLDGTEVLELEKHILDAETNELKEEYRDLSKKEQSEYKKSDIFCKKPRYPILRQEILENNGAIDSKLQADFEWALDFINQYISDDLISRKDIPVMEIQFKTAKVEQETTCGRAQHVKYKQVNEEDIKKKYFNKQLVRGVDFPFVFIRNAEGDLQIEHTSKTLISMWPFLEEVVEEYHEIHSCPVANYDMFFSKVFPELDPYVEKNLVNEPSIPTDNLTMENAWSILRNKKINNSFILPDADKVLKVELERK